MPGSRRSPARAVREQPFQYALVQVVPFVERGERFNAGVIVHCPSRRYLAARVALDRGVLAAIAPGRDAAVVQDYLEQIPRLCAGDPEAGPLARLRQAERFHWLVSPGSTVLQPSEVHTGLTADPAATLDHLFATLVERAGD